MSNLVGVIAFFLAAIALVCLAGWFVTRKAARQERKLAARILRDLAGVFGGRPLPASDATARTIERLLPQSSPLRRALTSRRPPQTYGVQGKNDGHDYLGAVVRHVAHQSGGPRRYTFLYARRAPLNGSAGAPGESGQDGVSTYQSGDWAVAAREKPISGAYTGERATLEELRRALENRV
jgi:hypothetical protein